MILHLCTGNKDKVVAPSKTMLNIQNNRIPVQPEIKWLEIILKNTRLEIYF